MSLQDEFPDDFQNIDWDTVDIPALREPSSYHSESYFCDDNDNDDNDEINDAFLAELDALEERVTQEASFLSSDRNIPGSGLRTETSGQATSSTSSSSLQISRFFIDSINDHPLPHSLPQKTILDHDTFVKKYRVSPLSGPSREKGKMKSPGDTNHIRQILEGFEHEIICPICCDVFVATHLGNPCGHSFCGECGLKWIANNRTPTCAVCRSDLSPLTPMIPNFVVDNTVDKYVNCLSLSGNVDWEPGGAKLLEWTARKEQWKKAAAVRTSGAPRDGMAALVYREVLSYGYAAHEDDDLTAVTAPGRRVLRSRFSIRPRQM